MKSVVNTVLKVVHEVEGKHFVELDASIVRLLRLKDGNLVEQRLSQEGVLLSPYDYESHRTTLGGKP